MRGSWVNCDVDVVWCRTVRSGAPTRNLPRFAGMRLGSSEPQMCQPSFDQLICEASDLAGGQTRVGGLGCGMIVVGCRCRAEEGIAGVGFSYLRFPLSSEDVSAVWVG